MILHCNHRHVGSVLLSTWTSKFSSTPHYSPLPEFFFDLMHVSCPLHNLICAPLFISLYCHSYQ